MAATHQQEREVPNPVQIQKFLSGLDYPVEKPQLIHKAKEEGADDKVLRALERIPEKTYESPISVSREVGRLE